jgi:hypothetical protein
LSVLAQILDRHHRRTPGHRRMGGAGPCA